MESHTEKLPQVYDENKKVFNIPESFITDNPNNYTLGEKLRQMYNSRDKENFFKSDDKAWIYESPDGGKTVTRRKMGADISTRETLTNQHQLELFK